VLLYDLFDVNGNGNGSRERIEISKDELLDRGFDMAQLSGDWKDDNNVRKSEVWTLVLEHAYAKLHGGWDPIAKDNHASYAWQVLTGFAADMVDVKGQTDDDIAQRIKQEFDAGNAVTIATYNTYLGGFPKNHALVVMGVDTDPQTGKIIRIKLYNPWGRDDGPLELTPDELNESVGAIGVLRWNK
jgi:hypothetical protein